MNKVDSDKVKSLIHRIGLKNHLPDSVINKIVNSQFRFARESIVDIKLEGIENEEDFNKLKTNFIFIGLGKLYTNYNVYKKLLNQKDKLKEYHNLKQNKNEIE